MSRSLRWTWLLLFVPCAVAAAQPVAIQPFQPPAGLAQPADPTVVGNLEHLGWSLTGPRARHYIFGGLAVADYVWQGKRRMVTLQEQTDFPKPDPDYLYYRELRSGNWWAFRKHPWPDRTYSVWFRDASQPGSKWQRLQLAQLTMPSQ
jgi:hypothetical protein